MRVIAVVLGLVIMVVLSYWLIAGGDESRLIAGSDESRPAVTHGAPRLQQVDGGTGYYAKYSHALPTGRHFFPIATWLQSTESQEQIAADKGVGINTYVGVANPPLDETGKPVVVASELGRLQAKGMHALIQAEERTRFTRIASETAGWVLADEIDMLEGPSACPARIHEIGRALPADKRIRYSNYGKGVLLWETDAEAACFVEAQDLQSADLYFFSDPNQRTMVAPPWLPEYDPDPDEEHMTRRQVRRAANYGYLIDRMRQLDAIDGQRKPIWAMVEVGWPFKENSRQGGRRIRPGEIRAAVWHSIIAGARGVIYFDHQFGGCADGVLRGPCYPDNRTAVAEVDRQIARLAPVLNAPSVRSGWTVSPSVRAMVKWYGGHLYVFAAAKENARSTATVSIPC